MRGFGKTQSRTRNVSVNTAVALVCQGVNLFLNFITRTIFINVLGAEYLGVNGLFTNVLTILSFAELGIGNAIVYSMYRPLAEKNEGKLSSLMHLYQKAYTMIGVVVAVVGMALTPFLHYIVKDVPDIKESISTLYLLFLANTVVSYFFVYKKSIIIADQKNYVVLAVSQVVLIIRVILQTIFLYLTHAYIVYLVIQIICTLIDNVVSSCIADRRYPFLKSNTERLSKQETRKIFEDVKALVVYKFGSVILNGTDNILISMMIGVREVGLVSNYVLLASSCQTILGKITEAFTASVGNLNATESAEKQYDIFKKLFFITSWIFAFATVGLITVSRPFIISWLGTDYLLGNLVVFGIFIEFYVKGVHSVCYTYRTTLGLFKQGQMAAILAAVTNIILSVILCKKIGLAGIFIATPIARIFSLGIIDPGLIFHEGFHRSVKEYHMIYIGYGLLYTAIGGVCEFVVYNIQIASWLGVIVDAIVVSVIFNGIMLLVFARTKMFKEILGKISPIFTRLLMH